MIHPRLWSQGKRLAGWAALLSLAACTSKDKEVVPSKVSLLTTHNWRLSAWTSVPGFPLLVNNVAVPYTNMFELYRNYGNTCALDQHFTFANGPTESAYEYGAYNFRQGVAACTSQFVAHGGKWYNDSSTGKILLYLEDVSSTPARHVYNQIYTVSELTSSQLIMSYRASIAGSSTVYVFTFTFTTE